MSKPHFHSPSRQGTSSNSHFCAGVYLANDRDNLPSNKEAGVEGSDDEPPLIGTNQTEPASETENLLKYI